MSDSMIACMALVGCGKPGKRNAKLSGAYFDRPGDIVGLPDGSAIVSGTLQHYVLFDKPHMADRHGQQLLETYRHDGCGEHDGCR